MLPKIQTEQKCPRYESDSDMRYAPSFCRTGSAAKVGASLTLRARERTKVRVMHRFAGRQTLLVVVAEELVEEIDCLV